jgi:YHYH protein
MKLTKISILLLTVTTIFSCNSDDDTNPVSDCTSDIVFDDSVGPCNETLTFTPQYNESISGTTRTITANNIPEHKVGLFGNVSGALNPNAISEQSETYSITTAPSSVNSFTPLLGNNGPDYSFGVLFNGVELDPVAAEPFPHNGIMDPNVNWEWNLEALNVDLGLDCNHAHVQPTGKYHYHGNPTLFIDDIEISTTEMTLIGYAADGFPVYYKYAYSEATDNTSAVIEMTSSYQLKTGDRPGDGITAPCGPYNGVYSNDYVYVSGLGTLDEANARTGVTPEYPSGTYYYIITDDFPSIPRYFRGTPSSDFGINQ